MSYTYSVTVTNHSAHSDYFMVFQNDPGRWSGNALALAWFSKFSNPGENVVVQFSWTVDWGFSWAETGELKPGITYQASDIRSASPTMNKITLDYNGAYEFVAQGPGEDPDHFFLTESPRVPIKSSAAVGITMSGSTVYATQAMPNSNLTFSPHPTYYLAYGDFIPGQVIDVSTINNPLELVFDPGIYALTTTLNADDSWAPPVAVAVANERLLAGKRRNPKLTFTGLSR